SSLSSFGRRGRRGSERAEPRRAGGAPLFDNHSPGTPPARRGPALSELPALASSRSLLDLLAVLLQHLFELGGGDRDLDAGALFLQEHRDAGVALAPAPVHGLGQL